jgi:adenylate kinase family enzyme
MLADRLARLLGAPHVELDALFWAPDWQETPEPVFLERVAQATAGDRWVVDGNYSKTRPITWPRADTVVWLDYPLWLILWRLLRRAIHRIRTQEPLWSAGNRETWRGQFLSRESLFVYAIKVYRKRRRDYARLFQDPAYQHLTVVRLYSPGDTERWISDTFAS